METAFQQPNFAGQNAFQQNQQQHIAPAGQGIVASIGFKEDSHQ